MLQIQELARQYEAEGGLSFRGFVDELRDAADRAQTPEAPILEEGTDGVRLMTVHKAKGLEFPVVILADIGCKLHRPYAQRHLDAERGLAAVTLSGWTPLDLSEHNDLETVARSRRGRPPRVCRGNARARPSGRARDRRRAVRGRVGQPAVACDLSGPGQCRTTRHVARDVVRTVAVCRPFAAATPCSSARTARVRASPPCVRASMP